MAKTKDNSLFIRLDKFYQGLSPAWFKNTLSAFGNAGHANDMTNCDILTPDYITQGAGLANLTGTPTELLKYIMDRAVTSGVTYGIGNTKLWQLTSSAISAKRTISGATRGESVFYLKGYLYYVYQDDFGRYNLASTYDDDWGSTVPTGKASLQDAIHPVATKEDIALIGNGRYMATFVASTATLNATKLDFGNNTEVSDVVFHNNRWLIAVNTSYADDDNRGLGYLYWYDGSAVSALLEDEASIGIQKIGFIKVINGVVFVAFQDLSSTGGYKLGYLSGNQIKTLVHFTGSLPNFRQKTLYKNTLLFLADNKVWSAGASVEELPFALSQIADGGYSTVGAIAAPFGTPIISSYQSTSYRVAKFSGYETSSNWTSLIMPTTAGSDLAYIDKIIITTEALGTGARCDITLKYNDEDSNSGANQISTKDKRRHIFKLNDRAIENLRVYLDFSNGSATNPVKIKYIDIRGHFLEY